MSSLDWILQYLTATSISVKLKLKTIMKKTNKSDTYTQPKYDQFFNLFILCNLR